jgi:hypothetical protein
MEAYTAFTIDEDMVVTKGIRCTTPSFDNLPGIGANVRCLVLGEEGRNRKIVYVRMNMPKDITTMYRCNVEYNTAGHVMLSYVDENLITTASNTALIYFPARIGFRGGNQLLLPNKENILAKGRIAQGDAGRMAAGSQWLFTLDSGTTAHFTITGRTYGRPSEYRIVYEHGELAALPPDVVNMLSG